MKAAVVIVLLLFSCVPVFARECILSTLVQAANVYPIVLLGRAVTSRDEILSGYRGMFAVVDFEVRQLWKGTTPKVRRLYQPITAERIQFEKAIGVEYVIFARELTAEQKMSYSVPPNVTGLAIDYCASRTAQGMDLTSLGTSRPPVN